MKARFRLVRRRLCSDGRGNASRSNLLHLRHTQASLEPLSGERKLLLPSVDDEQIIKCRR